VTGPLSGLATFIVISAVWDARLQRQQIGLA
jgi:hypothetical protein